MIANASQYGIDSSKVCIAGESGGGWIIIGAANLLAKANDLSKIKAIFCQNGLLSDSTQDLPTDKLDVYETK